MKYPIFFPLFFINLLTPSLSCAMDDNGPKKPKHEGIIPQKEQRLDNIDIALRQHYENNTICCGLITPSLSENDHMSIVKLVNSFYRNDIPTTHIHRLKNRNRFFAETINYFSDIARTNFDNVTLATLNTITDHTQQQPTPQLNKLSPALKKYVMGIAYNKIPRVHYTEFSGHTAPVISTAINPHALLASSTSHDHTFRLWSLATGKQLCVLPGKAIKGYMKFNDEGNLLATATVRNKNLLEIDIKIWDTKSHENIWTITRNQPFAALAFFQSGTKTTFAILDTSVSTLYRLKEYSEPILLGEHTQELMISPDKKDKGYTIKKEGNSWIAAKRSPRLYLCEQAIKNTHHITSSLNIENGTIFKDLIESEQEVIKQLLAAQGLSSHVAIN